MHLVTRCSLWGGQEYRSPRYSDRQDKVSDWVVSPSSTFSPQTNPVVKNTTRTRTQSGPFIHCHWIEPRRRVPWRLGGPQIPVPVQSRIQSNKKCVQRAMRSWLSMSTLTSPFYLRRSSFSQKGSAPVTVPSDSRSQCRSLRYQAELKYFRTSSPLPRGSSL
jgi:hypothetical protein